jgi:hypothetical protein
MSDKHYIQQTEAQRIRSWILHEMLGGAGKAAIVVVAIGLLMYLIHLLGMILPADSKTAPPPMPQRSGALEQPLQPTTFG